MKKRERERECPSQASKASRGTIARETQYWRMLKKNIRVSSALMTSQVRSCRCLKFAELFEVEHAGNAAKVSSDDSIPEVLFTQRITSFW